ncbi:phosphoribosylamine--glycine ligase [Roseomonas sp. AR75]|uniref:phosphoribosylamine--glycine ligase n=1 Tax=Roseomonas sp. AR75 TaxID=2562311 RepID=UPI0010C0DD07|nr:phosphoribosylamine--glycine ligase [Roseomonas sp. AR75]
MTRETLLALALPALLLGACSRQDPSPWRLGPNEPDSPVVQACRREAGNAPAVRDAWRQMNSTNRTFEDRVNAEVIMARDAAFDACLRRAGLRTGGGVERVRPSGYYW